MKPYDTPPKPVGVSIFQGPQPPPRCDLHVHRVRRSVPSTKHPVIFFTPEPEHVAGWRLLTTPWGEVVHPGELLDRQ